MLPKKLLILPHFRKRRKSETSKWHQQNDIDYIIQKRKCFSVMPVCIVLKFLDSKTNSQCNFGQLVVAKLVGVCVSSMPVSSTHFGGGLSILPCLRHWLPPIRIWKMLGRMRREIARMEWIHLKNKVRTPRLQEFHGGSEVLFSNCVWAPWPRKKHGLDTQTLFLPCDPMRQFHECYPICIQLIFLYVAPLMVLESTAGAGHFPRPRCLCFLYLRKQPVNVNQGGCQLVQVWESGAAI